MASADHLRHFYALLNRDAYRLAGSLNDLAQRATVYHHLFEHSGRNHVFPLIASHGALWARRYFNIAMKIGWLCSCQFGWSRQTRRQRLAELRQFADAFRDINRRVCIDTYTSYHFTLRYGEHADAHEFVTNEQLTALNRCHAQRRIGGELSTAEKREVFRTFFLNEQETVVAPSIKSATDKFRWPLMKSIALRPVIRFSYFRMNLPMRFRNFADKQDRIDKGLRAFNIGAAVGWDHVENSLNRYKVLPREFFADSKKHFQCMRETILASPAATTTP